MVAPGSYEAGALGAPVRVSVLITSYQHERYIGRALESVLEQSGDISFEVIVGDDASTDGTRAVIAEYAEAHGDRVRTVFPDANLGKGGKAIFAELIKTARGEYLAMLDGDDFWTSCDKLRRQVDHLDQHPECSMCFHDVICHYEDGSRPDVRFTGPAQATTVGVQELLDGFQLGSCSPVFRRETIDPLPSWYFELPWGDGPLYLMAAEHGEIHYLPDVMGVYRIHEQGMYRGLSRLDALELRASYYERLHVSPRFEALRRRRLAETWVKLGLEHELLEARAPAERCLRKSIEVEPFRPRRLRDGSSEKQRAALWLMVKTPTAVAQHPRLIAWRRRRAKPRLGQPSRPSVDDQ
jgi:glycosyltransferase involved in cell wall biosynthesis